MRRKTTERAKRRRQTQMAQALIASAARETAGHRLLTAYLVELRRAERLRLTNMN